MEVKQGWAQLKKETQPTTCSNPIVIPKLSAEKSYLHPLRSWGFWGEIWISGETRQVLKSRLNRSKESLGVHIHAVAGVKQHKALAAVEMFIKPCSFKQGGGSGSEDRRRKVSELRAEFARQASEDPTKSRRRKVSDLREELSRQASDEQARNRRRKASELREAFARRAENKGGRGEERSREKSQELTSSPCPASLYRVLGVDDEASNKEIRKAFLEKVIESFPENKNGKVKLLKKVKAFITKLLKSNIKILLILVEFVLCCILFWYCS